MIRITTVCPILVVLLLSSGACAQSNDLESEFDRLCVMDHLFSEEEVGPDFSIQLSFHETPVAGARIELEYGGKITTTAPTDSRGVARFSAIPAGEYWPRAADGLAFPNGSLEIKVVTNHSRAEKVKLEWPASSISVRGVRGRFTTSERLDDPDLSMQSQRVELRNLRTAQLIESTQTNANGEYEFQTAEPGLYALRVSLPKKGEQGFESHDLAVEIVPTALESSLPEMKAVQSDCNGVQFYRRSNRADWTWEQQ